MNTELEGQAQAICALGYGNLAKDQHISKNYAGK
jgi:hypothetical protein